MIGNDIVDLLCARKESNWKRKGYLNKIYSSSEQRLIHSTPNAEIMVWILWVMKEASYKANHRITGLREYAPINIKCSIKYVEHNVYFGTAVYNGLEYNTKTIVYPDYIHSIALHNSSGFSKVTEILIPNFPSNYQELLKIKKYLLPSECIIKDDLGIPNIFNNLTKEIMPISISHHGNFLILIHIKE
ncbi:4'-phosphopantetheinyl transferase family protein [Flavobacterium tegetincola]|uniref:4'-phosphopantetheinyl transferase family protein n=1 Tax=Flavobacterium tegetincola TaxID=150172 RepID=UPI0004076AC2|nr:4'-phosphopantetheinyl transferase superfamily protein [Flavobacterium tegetincola]